MKKLLQNFLLLILSIVLSPILKAQNLYELDLSYSAINCTTTCGVTNPAFWKVNNNSCNLITKDVYYPNHPNDSAMVAAVTIYFASVGNFTCSATHTEGIIVSSSTNDGPWFTHSRIYPCNITSNFFTSFKLRAPAGAAVRLKVNVVVNGNNKHVRINNGEIIIGEASVANSVSWVKRETNNGNIKEERENENPIFWVESLDAPKHDLVICRFSEADQTTSFMEENTASILDAGWNTPTLKVFPNPAAGNNFNVKITGSKEDEILVILYDQLGREYYSKVLMNKNGDFLEAIDCEKKLSPGVYLITGTNKNELYRQTLIVK